MLNMLDFLKFKFCPRCGNQQLQPNDAKSFVCRSCGFVYYHGSAAVVSAIVEWEDRIILTTRGNEPNKGMLALPGGFVDYDESLETALIRELQEELNLTLTAPVYLCSDWERYPSRDVLYFTTIAFFVVRAPDITNITARDDIDDFQLIRPGDINYSKLAFKTDRVALERYRKQIAIQ
jgi:ADP-ribose pyrophosphatase YjhB (NUDIX family)